MVPGDDVTDTIDQASGVVLAQSVVDGKTNEITAFAPLLDRLDPIATTVTADALHTQQVTPSTSTDVGRTTCSLDP